MSVQAARRTEIDSLLDRVLGLPDDGARRQFVAEHLPLDWQPVVTALTDRVREKVRVDTAEALALAETAIAIANTIGSQTALARSFRAKANALYAQDHHAEAIELHQRAATLFETAGDDTELARTLSGSIQPLLLLGRYDEALAAGERAREIFARQGNSWRLARLEINLGNIYHRQDRFGEALAHYERAYRELTVHDDAEGMAAVLSNLSLCYISLNEFSRALEMYRMAREHCHKKGMPILVAYADYNIAYLHFLRGEYGRAIQMLRDAGRSARQAGDAYQLALCSLDLSEIYLEVNLSSEASELAREAHEGFQKLGFGYEAAKALAFAAIAASRQGQAFEALRLFADAREIFVRERNQVWPSLIDLYEALVLFQEGRLFEARRLCIEARDFFQATALRSKLVFAHLLLARIWLQMGDPLSARQCCAEALQKLQELDLPILTYQAEYLMGEIERSSNHPGQAYECYQRARAALEKMRANLRGEELKIAFFENKLEVYENLVELCLHRPQSLEEAFGYVEQAKSRNLMDMLVQPVHVLSDADAGQSELVRSIRSLREELNWYYNLIEREQLRPEERSPERIRNFEVQARARESDLMHALQEATEAELRRAGMHAPHSMPLEEIRATLPAETALVEYFRIQDRNIVCVLSRDCLEVRPVTIESRVRKRLQLLQFQLSKFRLDPQYVTTFQDSMLQSTQAHLQELYKELISPFEDLLGARHLIFVPHGLLHYVPFHALHDGTQYLIDRFLVSYAPTASIYALCQLKPANQSGNSLLMGISDEQTPLIRNEVETLAGMLPNARLFVGSAATEEVLRTHGPGSRIVHIATHGYFRQDNPMFSSIRLGSSYLSLYDLYHFDLPVELVVLSGCATGLNVIAPGDELLGLVRGLLQAGAQSLVLSLWDVHDASTREFMIGFYRRMEQGLSKAEAVQGAMHELRQHYPHPYYWAPFTLIGKG